jgi:hypothetical protein
MDDKTIDAFKRIIADRVTHLATQKLEDFNKTRVLCDGDTLNITATVTLDPVTVRMICLAIDVELPKLPPWMPR